MAKNKGTYRSQRELSSVEAPPDEVVARETVSFFTKHQSKILLGCGLVVLLIIGGGLWRWRAGKRATAATELYQQATAMLEAEVTATPSAQVTPPGRTPAITFTTVESRAQAALALLDQIDGTYAGSATAKNARLLRAGVLMDLGRYSDAEAVYRALAADADLDATLAFVAREGLAQSVEARALLEKDEAARKAGLAAALTEYKRLQPDAKGVGYDAGLFHQARVTQLAGDAAGAKALYKQLIDTLPASGFVSEATARMNALDTP